jgi:hypothetical protein
MSSELKTNKISPATGTALQIGDSGDTITIPSGATLTNSGTASGFGLFTSYAIIADQKAQNTDGGTFTSGAWRERDLQTEIADPDGIVSISSNQFTLGAGTYLIKWTPPAWNVRDQQSRLYNVTDSSEVGVGASNDAVYFGNSTGSARVTITGSTAFSIEHQCLSTISTNGFGVAANFGTEQYTIVEIFKEA